MTAELSVSMNVRKDIYTLIIKYNGRILPLRIK